MSYDRKNAQKIKETRRTEFDVMSAALVALLRRNNEHRAETLADPDLLLIHDTVVMLEYLRTKVARLPNLVLSDEFEEFNKHLSTLSTTWSTQKTSRAPGGSMPLIPVIDVEVLYHQIDAMIFFAVAQFSNDRYEHGPGLFDRLTGLFSGTPTQQIAAIQTTNPTHS